MNDQTNHSNTQLKRPSVDVRSSAWHDYWQALGQSWRTEPEIDAERQKFLADRLSITPSIEYGTYPFKDIKINRADVEWLLATYENERDPVDLSGEQHDHNGLDLRGADLRMLDLSNLPLAFMRGGLRQDEWTDATPNQRSMATVHLDQASLYMASLEGASFRGAHLEQADIRKARLTEIDLHEAHLEQAFLQEAFLEKADVSMAYLTHASLHKANLKEIQAINIDLEGANLEGANLSMSNLTTANLKKAHLYRTDLQGTNLQRAHLEETNLCEVYLDGANLRGGYLQGANLSNAYLANANLKGAFFDTATNLEGVKLSNEKFDSISLADVHWGEVNLSVVDWSQIKVLGDELVAWQRKTRYGEIKERAMRIEQYQTAVRANRQLALALRDQGLSEEAARFSYRAQKLQCVVLLRQKKLQPYAFSKFLDLIAGYGYRPWRIIQWYLILIFGFAIVYYELGHLSLFDALIFSFSSFLGRGFLPSLAFSLHNPIVVLAVFEAILGLFIEVTFIAIFTRRFLER